MKPKVKAMIISLFAVPLGTAVFLIVKSETGIPLQITTSGFLPFILMVGAIAATLLGGAALSLGWIWPRIGATIAEIIFWMALAILVVIDLLEILHWAEWVR